jgi:hypothetical protein
MPPKAPRLLIVCLTLLFVLPAWAGDPEPYPYSWGMTLEEMNQVLAKTGAENAILREDLMRSRTILPYNPRKAIEVSAGQVAAVFKMKKSEGTVGIGQMFGYLYQGKLFCRAQLFKDSPFFSYQSSLAKLKTQYPEGKIYRTLSDPTPLSYFEYLSNEIYVFSNEQGIYICEPHVLSRAVQEIRKDINTREARDLETLRENLQGP